MIVYTGEGGRDLNTGRQIADQTLTKGNLALERNYREGNPIRVIRGHELDSPYAPKEGYRYDGLYRIESCYRETGKDNFLIWRYRLDKILQTEQLQPVSVAPMPPDGNPRPGRTAVHIMRVIRSSPVGNYVKENLYDFTCQISGERLTTPTGPYAEACHIRPLGGSHKGPDEPGNVLCLSPNMHVLFDLGAIAIDEDLKVLGSNRELKLHPDHKVSKEHLRYHRERIFKGTE